MDYAAILRCLRKGQLNYRDDPVHFFVSHFQAQMSVRSKVGRLCESD
jgi:hypothetical protein